MTPFTPLSSPARTLFYLQALVRLVGFWLPFLAAVTFGIAVLSESLTVAFAVGAGLLFLRLVATLWLPTLAWQNWGWRLTDDELLTTRGVWVRVVTAIPVGRVQHVDVRQGPIERWLGLCHLQVHTASGIGADGVVPGLEFAVANEIRDRLVARVARADDGV